MAKVSRAIGSLKYVKTFLPNEALKTLYCDIGIVALSGVVLLRATLIS